MAGIAGKIAKTGKNRKSPAWHAGIVFIDENGGGVGVRLRDPSESD
ncbi:MAG: hypothetical protein V3V17_03860 [Alphaproteobacteria bacterium]